MKQWKFNATVSVADSWIADGFDVKERIKEIEELLTNMLPYAREHEIKVKVEITSAPDESIISGLMSGTEPVKD